jgi:glycosyltransferase 2 family protein
MRAPGRRGPLLLRVAAVAAGALLFTRVLSGADLARATVLLGDLGLRVLWIVPVSALPFLLDAIAFRTLLRALGSPAPLAAILRVTVAVEAVVVCVPGGPLVSELLKPYLLDGSASVPPASAIAAIGARKVLMALAHGVTLAAAAICGHAFWTRHSPGLAWLVFASGLTIVVVSLVAARGLARGGLAERLQGALARIRQERLRRWALDHHAAFARVDGQLRALLARHSPAPWRAFAWLVGNWLCEAAVTLLLLRLLGAAISPVEALCLEAAVALLRSLVFVVPAGLGIQDLGYVTAFAVLGITDDGTLAAAFVLLKRAKELFWVVLGGALLAGGALRGRRRARVASLEGGLSQPSPRCRW